MPDRTPPLDFLPPAYVALQKSWRWALVQASAVLLLAAGLLLGVVRIRSDARNAEGELSAVERELATAQVEQQKLQALTQLRDQGRRQDRLLSSAGLPVEPSRLLMAIERVIPGDTFLTDLGFEVMDQNAANAGNSLSGNGPATALTQAGPDPFATGSNAQSQLEVTLRGLATGEIAVGNVLAALSKSPVFRHVNLTYAKDRQRSGIDRPRREFEVTFQINLGSDGEVVSTAREGK